MAVGGGAPTNGIAAWFAAGLLGTYVFMSFRNHLQQGTPLVGGPRFRKQLKPASEAISLKALEEVFRSSEPQLQESALQILLDRAMHDPALQYLIDCCRDRSSPDMRKRAVAVIQQLTKQEGNRSLLARRGILKDLVRVLMLPNDAIAYRFAVISLFRLVQNRDHRKSAIVRYGVLRPLKKFLALSTSHSNDLMYWSLLLTHQISIVDELQVDLIEAGYLLVLGRMVRITFGNANMQKLCLHSIIRLLSKMETTELLEHLRLLLSINILPLIVSCLRNEDIELASWAMFLLHEFITKEQFHRMNGLLNALGTLLSSDDSCIPRLVLRSLKYLGMRNDEYQLEMIRNGFVQKIVPLLSGAENTDPDCPLWAMALLHDLLAHREAHEAFFSAKGLDTLLDISYEANVHICLYIADIIVYLATSQSAREKLEDPEVLDVVLHFCRSDETELQYAGAALLLNLATFSGNMRPLIRVETYTDCRHKTDNMTDMIAEKGSLELLADLILQSGKENIQTVAAKTLVTVTRRDPLLRDLVSITAIHPLVTSIILESNCALRLLSGPPSRSTTHHITSSYSPSSSFDLGSPLHLTPDTPSIPTAGRRQSAGASSVASDSDHSVSVPSLLLKGLLNPTPSLPPPQDQVSSPHESFVEVFEHLVGYLVSLGILLETELFESLPVTKLDALVGILAELLLLPIPVQHAEPAATPSVVQSMASTLDSASSSPSYPRLIPSIIEHPPNSPGASPDSRYIEARSGTSSSMPLLDGVKDEVAAHILNLFKSLLTMPHAVEIILNENILAVIVALMQVNRGSVSDQAIIVLAHTVTREDLRPHVLEIPSCFTGMLWASLRNISPLHKFYITLFVETVCDYTEMPLQRLWQQSAHYARFDPDDATPYILMTPQGWDLRNESWTFETAKLRRGGVRGGKWAYEVELATDGVVQIGWVSDAWKVDPEAGAGVGDDHFSYAYDGHRRKKWHGVNPSNNEYGEEWFEGDAITVLLDLDIGQISYMRNGTNMGVAFNNVSMDMTWYPAISLATMQGCRVKFGHELDPLQHLPADYRPISHILTDAAAPRRLARTRDSIRLTIPSPSPQTPSIEDKFAFFDDVESSRTDAPKSEYFDAAEEVESEPVTTSPVAASPSSPLQTSEGNLKHVWEEERVEFVPAAYFEAMVGFRGLSDGVLLSSGATALYVQPSFINRSKKFISLQNPANGSD
ncbi:hypothetical protein DFS34DRAFT_380747 [Phlyctochytrium arcticum]|nr:hypothetical protein DFS34DRAFT_380747 [Phlyctochytrium arcticum]